MFEDSNILVSICCITYNHGLYIRQCLESFLMQVTSFSLEIIINDDASDDNTAEIIKEYHLKYPKIIKPTYQKENQYSKGVRGIAAKFTFPRARGKYIALCEGDDYWTDPYKLQKQVDYLEQHPDYSICFHDVKILEDGKILDDYITRKVGEDTDILELSQGNYIHTTSVLFRNNKVISFPEQFSKAPVGDYFLHMLNAQHGKIRKINQVMAVYRVHKGGLHSTKTQAQKNDEWLMQLNLMIPCFEGEVKNRLINSFLQFSKSVLINNSNISNQRQTEILKQIVEYNPDYLINLMGENEKLRLQLSSPKSSKKALSKFLKFLTSN